MLEDRGYAIPVTHRIDSLQEFRDRFGGSRTRDVLEFQATNIEGDKILIVFPDEQSIKVPFIASVAEKMLKEGLNRTVLICKGTITSTGNQAVADVSSHFKIEYFHDKELLINITHHELVPKHIPLSEDEKQKLLQRYKVKENQLPKIQISDPVARYLGLSRGQVVKIIRASETAGKYITYRLAI